MKIGIDVSQFAFKGSGVARYTETLIESLIKYDKNNSYILFFSSLRKAFPADLKEKLPENFTLKEFKLPPTLMDTVWNRLNVLPIETLIGEIDIFFSSDWTEPPVKKALKLTTIHDLVTYKFPETSHPKIIATQKRRLMRVKKESHLILCDSKATKEDVINILHVEENRLEILYPSVEISSPSEKETSEVMKNYNITTPYILSVGKLEPRKNLDKLIKAFKEIAFPNTQLIIVGAKGWGEELGNANISQNIRFLGFIPDKDLYALYKNALYFIYPSLYEGFGYPVVEAMNLGCPVATSNNSSLGEIAADNGVLFNPNEVLDIARGMRLLHQDGKLRETLAKKGAKRARDFSSERFAKQLLEIFSSLNDHRN